ncbi:MAG: 4Fe-4S binding protein [Negativicutes bacterium]|nr:4Fe-4S binding protein [Negativicutes bacterium]
MLNIGSVTEAGKSRNIKTGAWRAYRPVVGEGCNGCGICDLYCPDNCVTIIDKKSRIDYDYCKGCGICARECPKKVITLEEERK